MTKRNPPTDDDPSQLPVEPEFPAQDVPAEPQADEGKPGKDEGGAASIRPG